MSAYISVHICMCLLCILCYGCLAKLAKDIEVGAVSSQFEPYVGCALVVWPWIP